MLLTTCVLQCSETFLEEDQFPNVSGFLGSTRLVTAQELREGAISTALCKDIPSYQVLMLVGQPSLVLDTPEVSIIELE